MSDEVCEKVLHCLRLTDAASAVHKTDEFANATNELHQAGKNAAVVHAMARLAFSPPVDLDLTTRYRAGLLLKQSLRIHWDTLSASAALQALPNPGELTDAQFAAAVEAMRGRVLSNDEGKILQSTFELIVTNVVNPQRELRRCAASALAQWAVAPTGPVGVLVFSGGQSLPKLMCDLLDPSAPTSANADAALDVLLAFSSAAPANRHSDAFSPTLSGGEGLVHALTQPGAGFVEALPRLAAFLEGVMAAAVAAPRDATLCSRAKDTLTVLARVLSPAIASCTITAMRAEQLAELATSPTTAPLAGGFPNPAAGDSAAAAAAAAAAAQSPLLAVSDFFADVLPPLLPTVIKLCPLTVQGAPLGEGSVQAACFGVITALASSSGKGSLGSPLFRQMLEYVCRVVADDTADAEARQSACSFVEELVDVPSRADDFCAAAPGIAASLLPALKATAQDEDLFEQEAANASEIPPASRVGGRRRAGAKGPGEGGPDEDEGVTYELTRVENVWTLRKAAALALDALASSVQGALWTAPFEPAVIAALRSGDPSLQCTALYALAAIASGVPDALEAAGCLKDVLQLATMSEAHLMLRVTGVYVVSSYAYVVVDAMQEAPHGQQVVGSGGTMRAADAVAAVSAACASEHVQLQTVALQALAQLLTAMSDSEVELWPHIEAFLNAVKAGLATRFPSCLPMAFSVAAQFIRALGDAANTPLPGGGGATPLAALAPALTLWPDPPGGWDEVSSGGVVARSLLPEPAYVNPVDMLDAMIRACPTDRLMYGAVAKAVKRLVFYCKAVEQHPSELVCTLSAAIALDVLSSAFEVSGDAFVACAARHGDLLSESAIAAIPALLVATLRDQEDYVRRMAFAAVGEALGCIWPSLAPHSPEIVAICLQALEPDMVSGVATNAAWALGGVIAAVARSAPDVAWLPDAATATCTACERLLTASQRTVGYMVGQNTVITFARALPFSKEPQQWFVETRNGTAKFLTWWARWACVVHDPLERADVFVGLALVAVRDDAAGEALCRAFSPVGEGFAVLMQVIQKSFEDGLPSVLDRSSFKDRMSAKEGIGGLLRAVGRRCGEPLLEKAICALPLAQQQIVSACLM